MIEHRTIHVHGRVQGVFFRSSACTQAKAFGIVGFVRNEPDGNVVIEAEGDPAALDEFVRWCNTGPMLAEVTHVEVEDGTPKHFTKFEIR
ncbi:acylphosphatase [Candidatus Uhrbacteria bacterium]|nr:acylphosphatase [Candidatus Uhrbacteria bacterium]